MTEILKLDIETAREHFRILCEALYEFDGAAVGGNLHILIDDCNLNDGAIKWLDEECLPKQRPITQAAQWAVERAILDIFMQFNEEDRGYIRHGYYI
jgi:hypothetical protein